MNDLHITIVGNLTDAPELRYTNSGAAVANFTIAHTPRVREGNEWKDGDTVFMRCSMWREQAENLVESLTRGARVIATGKLKQRKFDTKAGEQRTVMEMDVEEIGPSLRYATAKVDKVGRKAQPRPAPAGDDPWSAAPVQDAAWGVDEDTPPF